MSRSRFEPSIRKIESSIHASEAENIAVFFITDLFEDGHYHPEKPRMKEKFFKYLRN